MKSVDDQDNSFSDYICYLWRVTFLIQNIMRKVVEDSNNSYNKLMGEMWRVTLLIYQSDTGKSNYNLENSFNSLMGYVWVVCNRIDTL